MDIIAKRKKNIKNYKEFFPKNESLEISERNKLNCQIYRFGHTFDIDEEALGYKNSLNQDNDHLPDINEVSFIPSYDIYKDFDLDSGIKDSSNNITTIKDKKHPERRFFSGWLILSPMMIFFCILGGLYIKKGINTKKQVLGTSQVAYANVNLALDSIKKQDFEMSLNKFGEAYKDFSEISKSLEDLGGVAISVSRFIPGASKLSSGYYVVETGKDLSWAGEKISRIAKDINNLKNKNNNDSEEAVSLLKIFLSLEKDLKEINSRLISAQDNLGKIEISDIPKENQQDILNLKNKLPAIIQMVDDFSANSHLVADFLGANGPRKYLFLLQNNQEMRATGGFIGSYGILDIDGNGKLRNFFIDGIFNPDGQFSDKIIPPKPIQKISAAWSLHDSNWFPDFPISAKKAILFYEKTGGPTVDGVITLTPTVLQKMLRITGPIEMKDYGVVLTEDNFIQNIQYEVEENYDKEENKPKKILSDLAPIILDKIVNSKDTKILAGALDVFGNALEERQILLYFSNTELQKIISNLGWSGEILSASNDYLSVINTNINGYKTDGVVDEKIRQYVNIAEDGTIIDTVSITRKHNGGNTQYEWWNKVSSDYMRVYVPQGSTLLAVEGQTREINEDVLDYKSLNFEEDLDVENEESQIKIDENTGTRIYNESGKTVFANWIYVSPQEEVTITYKYVLPFKIDLSRGASNYSLLSQKQSGSLGDDFVFNLNYPNSWKEEWKSDTLEQCLFEEQLTNRGACFDGNLKVDKFMGIVFSKN